MGQSILKSYKLYASSMRCLLCVMGVWPLKEPIFLYRLLPYFVMCLLLTIAYVTMMFSYVHIDNLNLVLKGLGISLGYLNVFIKYSLNMFKIRKYMKKVIFCCFKVVGFVVYREALIELETTIRGLLKERESDEKLLSLVLSPFPFFKVLTIVLTFMAISVVSLYFVLPLMAMISQYRHDLPIKYLLPFPTVYPYVIEGGSLLYVLHYAMETFGCVCLFSITTGVDNVFALYAVQIIGQLRALSHEMKNLVFDEGYEESLRKFIHVHQKLLRCCELLERIYGPIILSMLVTTAFILCCLIFQISQMKTISIKQMLFFAVYIGLKMSQTWIYAWAGTEITDESDKMRNEVYASGWENLGNKSVGHYIRFLLMQKPILLRACSYTAISINLFTGILNTTVSYFFLLQTVEDKK